MKTIQFTCEVLTPLFSGGADPRGAPELRIPAIRGVLRYWYRTLIGTTLLPDGDGEIGMLQAKEAEVFGSTDHGSLVSLRLRTDNAQVETFTKDKAIRTRSGGFLPTGKDYLYWSMAASGRPNTSRYRPARKYLSPGTTFRLDVSSYRRPSTLAKVYATTWLWGNLGSLGARANRCAGSIQVDASAFKTAWPVFKTCQTLDDLSVFLSENIQKCFDLVKENDSDWRVFGDNTLSNYDILSPTSATVMVVANQPEGWNTYLDALNGIGERFRDFRSHRGDIGRKDHDAVLQWLEHGGNGPEIKRAAFGLPITFRYSGGGPRDVIISTQGERRGSPLHMRVTRLKTDKYVGVFTLFKSKFLEENEQLSLQTRRNWNAPAPSQYEVVENFIETFPIARRVL